MTIYEPRLALRSTTSVQPKPIIAAAIFALMGLFLVITTLRNHHLAFYGMVLFPILMIKLGLSLVPGRTYDDNDLRVGVVVTVYNEDAELVRQCLASLHRQTRRPHSIIVVDDASTDREAREVAALDPRVTLIVHETNMGKREALATGFRMLEGQVDVYACVDSDARLEPHAFEEGMRPFSSDKVMATTGMVVPSNHDENVLTRLIDVRYVNAFIVERGAYSTLNSVLCVCGVLAFYRSDMIHRHLDAFLSQRFLGAPAVVGDDRHLTNRALIDGDVVLAPQAIAHTAVPQNVSHYVRQQSRWGRSFFRESLWALTHHKWRRPAWWLTLIELTQWLAFTSLLVYILMIHPLLVGGLPILQYLVFVAITAVARSVRYFDLDRSDQSSASRIFTFVTTPLFGLLNLFVMIPLRLWSLITLRRSGWGTRAEVEIRATDSPSALADPRPTVTAAPAQARAS